jgi:TP901 family phage tail tape measure protein
VAGTQKQYELLFQLKASLGGNFTKAFNSALKVNNQLKDSIQKVNAIQGQIDGYTKTSSAIEKNQDKLQKLIGEHERLQAQLEETTKRKKELQKAMETAEAEGNIQEYARLQKELGDTGKEYTKINDKLKNNQGQTQQTENRIKSQREQLEQLTKELKAAGVNTDNLSAENKKLGETYDKLKKSQENLSGIQAQQEKIKGSIAGTRTELLKTTGIIAGVAAAIYAGPVQSAMAFESGMAEVSKVIGWLKDDTGETTKEYAELKKEIIGITQNIPMTAQEIQQIMAAAGQSNVAQNNAELVEFTKNAAKMGIAFDTTSDQAGEWMAKWRTSFNMNQQQVVELADKINFLGNTTGAKAAQISDIITRIGPLGDVAGFASGEIAALGASLVSTGVNEEVAATGIKNLMLAMNSGASATKRQQGVLQSLGLNATDLAKRMQTDAKGAVIDFLNAVKQLPEAEQAAALKNYFGSESVGAIAPLLTNLEYLEEQFTKVGDASQYAGSMEAEYASRADTTENKVLIAKNSIQGLVTVLSNNLLPVIGDVAEKLTGVVIKITDFAEANPELVKTIGKVVAGLAAAKVASLGLNLGVLNVKNAFLSLRKVFAIIQANKLTKAFGGVSTGLGGIIKKISPLLGVVGVIAAIGTAIYMVATHLQEVRGWIEKTFGSDALAIFDKIWGVITEIGAVLKSAFAEVGGNIFDTLREVLPPVITMLKDGVAQILPVIQDAIKLLIPMLQELASDALPMLRDLAQKIIETVGELIQAILPVVMDLLKAIIPIILQIVQAILPVLIGLIGKLIPAITSIITGVLPVLIELVKNLIPIVTQIISDILPVIIDLINELLPIVTQIIEGVLPVILSLIEEIIPLFMTIVDAILPVILSLLNALMPIVQQIIDAILPVLISLFNALLPVIQIITDNVLPVLLSVVNALVPVFQTIISAILPVLTTLLSALTPIIQVLADVFSAVLGPVLDGIKGAINGVITVLEGIIQFITGVFTGNWQKAWDGVKSIFTGIFDGIVAVAKGVINGITSAINVIIRGLNKLKIPDWVPVIGGAGINIPEIPQLAKGTSSTPSTFIAGEKGPELITNLPGRTVYTADQTRAILDARNLVAARNAQASQQTINNTYMQTTHPPQVQSAPELQTAAGEGNQEITLRVENNPTIIVNGEQPQDLERQLQANNENLIRRIMEMLQAQKEDERRRRYA